ncbi:hypothetical protein LR013_00625 [candidate division NPL-UPA2 bacterium]|nr:hypothetical protein [candidate division NPL-UPA2 bacterium]
MEDKKLEGKIELLKEFIEEWVGFRDFLKDALRDKTLSAEEERKFLEIKSQVTRKYQALTQALEEDFIPDEKLMDIVSHAVSLESMAGTSDLQFRKIENDWHLSYIHLNKLLGSLESERDRLANVSGIKVALGHFAGGVRRLCRGVVKVALVLVILAIAGLIGSYFLPGEEKREKGLVNYLVTTVREIVFERGESERGEE